jgi:hypothetical protein
VLTNRRPRSLALLGALGLVWLLASCSRAGDGAGTAPSSPPPRSLEEQVVQALNSSDSSLLVALIDPIEQPCQVQTPDTFVIPGLGCGPNQSAGTMLHVIRADIGCKGGWLQAEPVERAASAMSTFLADSQGFRLLATSDVGTIDYFESIAPGLKRLLFLASRTNPQRALLVGLTSKGIRLVRSGCAGSPEELLTEQPWPNHKRVDSP